MRAQFNDKLAEINSRRFEATQNKSAMRIDLLQQLRNQVFQINLASVSTQTQLDKQLAAATQELDNYNNLVETSVSGAQNTVMAQSQQSPTNPTTSLAVSQGGNQMQYTPTGITKKNEDAYV